MPFDKREIEMLLHDLNNPLSTLVANLDYIGSVVAEDSEALEAVQDCIVGQASLRRMLDNITAIMSLQEASTNLDSRMRISELITTVEESMRPHAEMAGHELTASCDPEVDRAIGEEKYLALALENLIATSMTYGKQAGLVEIRGRLVGDSSVGIAVLDDGKPLPPEVHYLIHELQSQATLKRPTGGGRYGRAFGLYVASLVATSFGGTLEASEEEGRSCFELILKRAK